MQIYRKDLFHSIITPRNRGPFKFLDSYTREDHEIFFGRNREIEEIYQKIFEIKILIVSGVSGKGRTFIINCGLANKFEDSDWYCSSLFTAHSSLLFFITADCGL